MKAYNCKRKPKHTTKFVYRRTWKDCNYKGRSKYVKHKQYSKGKSELYSIVIFKK